MVDRKVYVVGFGLYGSIHGPSDYTVNIQVRSHTFIYFKNCYFYKFYITFLLISNLLSMFK